MTKLQAIKKISTYLRLRNHSVRIYGIEEFADGYLAKYYRTYDAQGRGEDRVDFFFVPDDYPNEVHSKFSSICRIY